MAQLVGRTPRVCRAWRLRSADHSLWLAHFRSFFGNNKAAAVGRRDHRSRCIPVARGLAQWDRRCAQAKTAAACGVDELAALHDEKLLWACELGLTRLVSALCTCSCNTLHISGQL